MLSVKAFDKFWTCSGLPPSLQNCGSPNNSLAVLYIFLVNVWSGQKQSICNIITSKNKNK